VAAGDNGLNPVWRPSADSADSAVFAVLEPELSFLRFVVNEEDMFSDPNFLAQATFPVKGLRSGVHLIPTVLEHIVTQKLSAVALHSAPLSI